MHIFWKGNNDRLCEAHRYIDGGGTFLGRGTRVGQRGLGAPICRRDARRIDRRTVQPLEPEGDSLAGLTCPPLRFGDFGDNLQITCHRELDPRDRLWVFAGRVDERQSPVTGPALSCGVLQVEGQRTARIPLVGDRGGRDCCRALLRDSVAGNHDR